MDINTPFSVNILTNNHPRILRKYKSLGLNNDDIENVHSMHLNKNNKLD